VAAPQPGAFSTMPEVPPALEEVDLDVPAFIRKRAEIQ
jgi:hypothetical protein